MAGKGEGKAPSAKTPRKAGPAAGGRAVARPAAVNPPDGGAAARAVTEAIEDVAEDEVERWNQLCGAFSVARYVVGKGPSAGQVRPAVIVAPGEDHLAPAALHVFWRHGDTPHENAAELDAVPYDTTGANGTWHFPPFPG